MVYSWPLNNTGLNCAGPLTCRVPCHLPKNTQYPWVSHPQIQPMEDRKQYFHIPNCRFPIIFNWRLVESTMRRADCSTIFQCCHRILCSLSQWRSSVAQELMKNRHLFQWEFWYDAKIAKLARFVFLFLWITLLLSLFFHGHTPDHLFARCPGHLCCLSLAA